MIERRGAAAGMTASVIVCTYNRASRLVVALDALAAMELPDGIEWEVLVVDNASTDATRETIETFIRNGHPRFRYVAEPTPGKTYALNRGIAAARGEILAFTDDDAVVDRQWLARIVDTIQRYGADGVGGKVVPIWRGQRPAWLKDRFLNVLAVLDHGDAMIRLDWKNPPSMLYGVNYAFRRSVFERVGGFNTILGSRGEDQELFDRLRAARASVIYDPAIVVGHELVTDRLTKKYYRDWYCATGRARAKLNQGDVASILGIPLYTIRKGMATVGRLASAVVRRDPDDMFADYLTLNFWASFYSARLRAAIFSD